MAGRRSFAELRARMSPEAEAKAAAEAERLGEEMALAEVRRALKLSQEEIGQTLRINQGSVAKIERRADMYVSTLRRFIEAMGGELEITARFADHSIKIKNFSDLSLKERAARADVNAALEILEKVVPSAPPDVGDELHADSASSGPAMTNR